MAKEIKISRDTVNYNIMKIPETLTFYPVINVNNSKVIFFLINYAVIFMESGRVMNISLEEESGETGSNSNPSI